MISFRIEWFLSIAGRSFAPRPLIWTRRVRDQSTVTKVFSWRDGRFPAAGGLLSQHTNRGAIPIERVSLL
jgi:hypothetical protein